MCTSRRETTRGLLHRDSAPERFDLRRYFPEASPKELVDSFWITRWKVVRAHPHRVEILPHPTVQVVVELGNSGVFGIGRAKFEKRLEGTSRAVGIKFRPGTFARWPPSKLVSAGTPLEEVFGPAGVRYESAVLDTDDDREIVRLAERFVATECPAPDEESKLACRIVESAIEDRTIVRVDDLARRHGLSIRALQRLFLRRVGVSPKWVLKRFRIHEAVEQLEAGDPVDLAALASELSYFDQAHFVRDFTRLVGRPPGRYLAELAERAAVKDRLSE